ncbi:MAG: hypothetical protein HYY05_01195 [Chloroflexi bacterium]|nr:hypothetical protein [Chloroflexota bacterium]
MEEKTAWELLERLGAVRRGHFDEGEHHADLSVGGLHPLDAPAAVQGLASALAALLPSPSPDLILAWDEMPSVLLGLLIGVALDRPVARLADDEGVVRASRELRPGQRVVLVGDLLSERQVRLAWAFVESRGALLAGTGALVDDGRAGELVAVVALGGHRFQRDDCPLCEGNVPLDHPSGVPTLARSTG